MREDLARQVRQDINLMLEAAKHIREKIATSVLEEQQSASLGTRFACNIDSSLHQATYDLGSALETLLQRLGPETEELSREDGMRRAAKRRVLDDLAHCAMIIAEEGRMPAGMLARMRTLKKELYALNHKPLESKPGPELLAKRFPIGRNTRGK